MNLAVNARMRCPREGSSRGTGNVTLDEEFCKKVRNVYPESMCCWRVRDTGHGMDGETLDHIFEPFFTQRGRQGTGLG